MLLLPSEGLCSYRFNWYPDSRQLVDSAFRSCWERSRELMSVKLGRGYLPYLVNATGLLRWLESQRGVGEITFTGWENAPLREHTFTGRGGWKVDSDPFHVYLRRGRRHRPRGGKGEEYIFVRICYRCELLGPLESVFALKKGGTPEMLAAGISRLEREKAEKSVERLWKFLGEAPKDPPRLRFPQGEPRVIYAYLSHFLGGGMRKAEFFPGEEDLRR